MEVRIGMHQVDGRTGSATARAVLASFVDAICHNPISLSVATDMPVWAQSKPFRSTAGQLDTLVITARIARSRLVENPLPCRAMLSKENLLSCKHGSYSPAIGEKASMPERTNRTSPKVLGNINLRVKEEERWAFKAWCAEHRISQVDAFREAFDLLKATRAELSQEMADDVLDLVSKASAFTIDRDLDLRIERRGADVWAVCMGAGVVNRDLNRELEPTPSSRDKAFIERTRFSLKDALRISREWLISEGHRP